jgi:hypothetical protein
MLLSAEINSPLEDGGKISTKPQNQPLILHDVKIEDRNLSNTKKRVRRS